MGFTTSNLSLYHTFSKTPVDSNTTSAAAQLGNAINKSGHTVQSNEIWTESIPFFGLAATTTAIHNKFSATAKVNDLVKDADGKIWQRNSTTPQFDASGALTSTFADLWFEKTTSITSNVKVDGAYPTTDGALVDGSYLLNSEGVPTVKYYEKRLLTRLTADNNANTNSDNKASRLQIDGKWIDQFIGVTDIYVNGSAAVSYAPVLRKTASDSPMQAGPGKGYMDYCATGLILWESSAAGTEVIDCFEYVGAKLDATVAKLSAAVFGSGTPDTPDAPASLSEQVTANTTALNILKGADTVEGSIAYSIKTAIQNLGDVAVKSDIKISEIKVKVGSGEATPLTPDGNKSVTVEIPEVQAAAVSGGVITTDGFAKASDAKAIAEKAIESAIADGSTIDTRIDEVITTAVADGGTIDNRIDTLISNATSTSAIVDNDTSSKLVTASQVATYVASEVGAIDGKSLASLASSTQGSYVTVTTSGTIGDGLSVTVDDSALASTVSAASTAIQGITINGGDDNELVKVGEGNIVDITLPKNAVGGGDTAAHGFRFSTYAGDGDDSSSGVSGHYLHIAAASYDTNTKSWDIATTNYFTTASTVESFVNATVGADLATLETKVNNFHKAGVSYVVADTLPTIASGTEATYNGKVYLVNTGLNGVVAADGSRIEYMYVNKGSEDSPSWDWEQIGTTKTDLSGYAKSVKINGTTYTATAANAGALDLGTVVVGTYNDMASGTTSAAGQPNANSVYVGINGGTMGIGIASATDSVMGVSKMFSGTINGNSGTATDTAVSVKSASELYRTIASALDSKAYADEVVSSINGIKGGVTLCVHNTPEAIGGGSASEGTAASAGISTCANLWGMGVMTGQEVHGDTAVTIIDTFVGMTKSSSYLSTASLPSTAVSVENNFVMDANGKVITTIRPERMVSGFNAKSATGLKSFVGDLSNLENASCGSSWDDRTFYSSSALNTFIGDLSSLTDGSCMFHYCDKLTTFISDLSSLTDGSSMFSNCKLNVESLECIADTINEHEGTITISWNIISDEGNHQALVDELSRIVDKGWTLNTNKELLPLFDNEKYQTGTSTVQPLDLDSEPQTIYYVVKK